MVVRQLCSQLDCRSLEFCRKPSSSQFPTPRIPDYTILSKKYHFKKDALLLSRPQFSQLYVEQEPCSPLPKSVWLQGLDIDARY